MKNVGKKLKNQNGLIGIIEIIVIVLVLAAAGFAGWKVRSGSNNENKDKSASSVSTSSQSSKTWQMGDVAVAGKYADAEAVSLGDGKYRLYYAIEPEVQDNQLEVYSATSSDGVEWTPEAGIRHTFSTFPSIIKMGASWRMYFQNSDVIKSATSSDGLSWTDEPGVRIDLSNSLGLTFDNVGAMTIEAVSDGSFMMVYAGTIKQKYADKVPSNETHLFLQATSKDGLNWDKKGLAIDSRNSTYQGWVDGAELVKWNDGSLRLYYWGYAGVYYSTFKNNKFSDGTLTFTGGTNSNKQFPENPPGDPTLLKVGDTWYMYYGQHTKGIYYAVLK